MIPRIPRDAARRLGHYVYLYVDPRNGRPFYVGKGKGQRGLAHLRASGSGRKAKVLREISAAGLEPRVEILAHGLPTEEAAFRIEMAVIDVLGLEDLANRVRGQGSRTFGRRMLRELVDHLSAKPVEVRHPSILIRINKLYRPGMSETDLYDATRSAWKLGLRRERARFAFAVFEGVVKAVYEIRRWYPAGSTSFVSGSRERKRRAGRWEFTRLADNKAIQKKYVGRSVATYLRRGSQNPVRYVNCPK